MFDEGHAGGSRRHNVGGGVGGADDYCVIVDTRRSYSGRHISVSM